MIKACATIKNTKNSSFLVIKVVDKVPSLADRMNIAAGAMPIPLLVGF